MAICYIIILKDQCGHMTESCTIIIYKLIDFLGIKLLKLQNDPFNSQ